MRKNKRLRAVLLTAALLASMSVECFADWGPGQESYGNPGGYGTNGYNPDSYGPGGGYAPANGGLGYHGGTEYNAPENNPAYDTGWNSGKGPGDVGNNPMGNNNRTEEDIFSGGPNSEAAKKYMEQEENNLYIHSTYRGGVWEALPDGKWRLNKPDGQPVSSEWAIVDGKTYLLDMYGIMLTGFQLVNGNWYYLNSTGAMQTGWLLKEGKYYFLNSDGAMAYGWVNSQGSWYYMDQESGVMLTNVYTPDGRYVNAEGVMV